MIKYQSGLQWPDGVPMNFDPQYSRFGNHSLSQALTEVEAELTRFGVESAVITGDWSLSTRDYPLSDKRTPSPVAVHYRRNGDDFCIAICEYNTVQDNVWAVAKVIDAMRAIERHGGDAVARQAASGFIALPPPDKPWWEVFGVGKDADPDVVEATYKIKAKKLHPDKPGGSAEAMSELNTAYDQFKEFLSKQAGLAR